MEHPDDLEQRISGIASLDQPLRRDLHRLLSSRGGWVTRDEASEALAVPRSVAAFHLDKLSEAGLVDTTFERTTGRTGPGAGRPAKLYRRADVEVSASVPERRYDLAGSLLATAIAQAESTGAPIAECLTRRGASGGTGDRRGGCRGDGFAHHARGPAHRGGRDPRAAWHEPVVGDRGEIALVNCPFHRLAEEHRSLVCGTNLDFLASLIEGMGPADRLDARLAPEPGFCCVRIKSA